VASRIGQVLEWFQERLGTREQLSKFLYRRLPEGTTWWHTLGSATLFLIIVQTVTGFFLAFYYVPSPEHAYDSLIYIQGEIPFGNFVRGLHHWGASVTVVVVFLHMLRVFFMGAYKYPRELSWMAGVCLFLLILLFGFTGYLLSWDQKAYWATVVGTHIAGTAPLVGDYLWRILQGGTEVGARTLGRFYAAHVLILPAVLYAFVLVHISMVIYQGIAPVPRGKLGIIRKDRYKEVYEKSKAKGESFLEHLFRDGIVSFLLFLVLVWMAIAWKVPMEELADPTSTTYVPRPEWYFYFLFELLWLFPGEWIPVATFYIPVAGVLLLYSISLLDQPGDARRGERLFVEKGCATCHSIGGEGKIGPDLKQWKRYGSPILWAELMWNHALTMELKIRDFGLSWPQFERNEMVDLIAYIQMEIGLPGASK